jgi:hypothetical protein
LAGIIEDSDGEEVGPDIARIVELGLPALETFVEVILLHRGDFHRRYLVQCLDSLLLKNRPGALITQPRAKDGARRFIFDSRLLEVLLQIAVLRPGGALGYHTEAVRIDHLLTWFRERYGLYIDRLPAGDGFAEPSMETRAALRSNLASFVGRLREVGFYRDLSDAYITQTVSPRYTIELDGSSRASGGAEA